MSNLFQEQRKSYLLTDEQAEWIRDLLALASDPATGILDTTSSGGYRNQEDAAERFAFLSATMTSADDQMEAHKP